MLTGVQLSSLSDEEYSYPSSYSHYHKSHDKVDNPEGADGVCAPGPTCYFLLKYTAPRREQSWDMVGNLCYGDRQVSRLGNVRERDRVHATHSLSTGTTALRQDSSLLQIPNPLWGDGERGGEMKEQGRNGSKKSREGGNEKGKGARVKAGDSPDLSEERWGREDELMPFPREPHLTT